MINKMKKKKKTKVYYKKRARQNFVGAKIGAIQVN